MKNREKYAEEILDIACSGNKLAMRKRDKCLTTCDSMICQNCCFYGIEDCKEAIREWAESEYVEMVKISKRDKAFLDYVDKHLRYIARDMSGEICVYKDKPYKCIDCWDSDDLNDINPLMKFCIDFPMVKWSDAEPWKIEDLKNLEVCDEY